MPGALAHEWHKTYSVDSTKLLGNLACIVTSNIIGIGSADRHWKIIKAVKTGQRANTGTIHRKKQSLIYGASMHQKSSSQQEKLSSSYKLWSEDDFQGCKMGVFCNEIIDFSDAPQSNNGEVRIFHAGVETWDKKELGTTGDSIF